MSGDVSQTIISAVIGALRGKTTHIADTIMDPSSAAEAALAYLAEVAVTDVGKAGEVYVDQDDDGVTIGPGSGRLTPITPPAAA